jgi:transposase
MNVPSPGSCLCADELRTWRSLPVRLEPRDDYASRVAVEAAHMKLSHSRMPFVRVYFRETQELVFDAHDKAFQFYGGVCRRGIYNNMKTAVEAIFVGKGRRYNGRFLQMCSHHLIEPVACTPASGWEKGQVENQVGNLRDQFFRPAVRFQPSVPDLSTNPAPATTATPQLWPTPTVRPNADDHPALKNCASTGYWQQVSESISRVGQLRS